MSSICLKSVFLLERRHRPTFETDFQIRCGSCYEFPSYKTSARWEVLVDMKLACWFCAVRSDSKVKEEEETFVILMADHNISYSCGDTLMKLIKGSFHRQKTCQDHKQMSNKIQCLKQGNAIFSVLLCGLSFFTPVMFFHSIAKSSCFLLCPELFLMSTISDGMEYGQFGSAILEVPSVIVLPLPLLGYRKETKLWFPGWEMKPTGFSFRAATHAHPESLKLEVARGWQGTLPVQCTQAVNRDIHSGVLQLEQLQSNRRKGGCLLW